MSHRIIVIEDNEDVRENIAEILELSGYEVETAANGTEGVRMVQTRPHDLIICDIMMPELDGYGVLHILQRSEATSRIPFIFLTAKSEKEDFRKGMNLGADDYITKPFEELHLLEAVEMRLKKHREAAPGNTIERSSLSTTWREVRNLLQPLLEDAEVRAYPKKAPVYLEGSFARYLYFVEEGAVKKSRWTEFGKELITDLYVADSFFGWAGIVSGKKYRSVTSALEDTTLRLIPREKVLEVLHHHPDIYPCLLDSALAENEVLTGKLLDTSYESVRKRMANLLIALESKFINSGSRLHLLREDIAAMAGISKETAIRVLSSFKEEGLIDITNNEIRIDSTENLANIAG